MTCYCDEETDLEDLCPICLKYYEDIEKEELRAYRLYHGYNEDGHLIDVREPNKIIKYN